jgi:DNA primase
MQTIVENLQSRHMDIPRPGLILDETNNIATFWLYNLSGELVGYQRYNPNADKQKKNDPKGRYYNYIVPEGQKKKIAMWGMESLSLNSRILFVTEGIFDANRVHLAGFPCVAILTNNNPSFKAWFKATGRRVIAILDNDKAGEKVGGLVHESYVVPEPYKDLDEMPQSEVEAFLLWNILCEGGIYKSK